MKTLEEVLRDAMKSSGLTIREIARRAELHPSNVSRFMAGRRGLDVSSASRIATVFDLSLKPNKKGKK